MLNSLSTAGTDMYRSVVPSPELESSILPTVLARFFSSPVRLLSPSLEMGQGRKQGGFAPKATQQKND